MKKLLILFFLLLSGCSYSVYTTTLSHLKTIMIKTFENETLEYGLEEELLLFLSEKFNARNLKTVTISPDCILEGKIVSYEDKIFKYDADDNIESYQITFVFSVNFNDMVKNDELLKDNSMKYMEKYTLNLTDESIDFNLTGDSKEDKEPIREEIYSDLYEDIINKSFESW